MQWLARRPVAAALHPVDRATASQAGRLAQPAAIEQLPGWSSDLTAAWQTSVEALARYRAALPAHANIDTVLESLMHLHHNRIAGIDAGRERACRRLAYLAARAWRARRAEGDG